MRKSAARAISEMFADGANSLVGATWERCDRDSLRGEYERKLKMGMELESKTKESKDNYQTKTARKMGMGTSKESKENYPTKDNSDSDSDSRLGTSQTSDSESASHSHTRSRDIRSRDDSRDFGDSESDSESNSEFNGVVNNNAVTNAVTNVVTPKLPSPIKTNSERCFRFTTVDEYLQTNLYGDLARVYPRFFLTETAHTDSGHTDTWHTDTGHTDTEHIDSGHDVMLSDGNVVGNLPNDSRTSSSGNVVGNVPNDSRTSSDVGRRNVPNDSLTSSSVGNVPNDSLRFGIRIKVSGTELDVLRGAHATLLHTSWLHVTVVLQPPARRAEYKLRTAHSWWSISPPKKS